MPPAPRPESRAAERPGVATSRPHTDPAFALLFGAIDKALADLHVRHPLDARVHTARKALKKARAALRLLRPNLATRVYERENLALRDAGRRLSPVRDAKSLVAAVDLLGKPRGKGRRATKLAALRRLLERQLAEAWRRFARGPAQRECEQLVRTCSERMRRQERQAAGPTALLDALRAIYASARKAHARAAAARTPEALHEWRKQTKYLHSAAVAMRDAGIRDLRGLVQRSAEIAAWLGDDHDLVALGVAIERAGMMDDSIRVHIGRRQEKLRDRALTLGARVLRAKPKRFVASLSAPPRHSGAPARLPRARKSAAAAA